LSLVYSLCTLVLFVFIYFFFLILFYINDFCLWRSKPLHLLRSVAVGSLQLKLCLSFLYNQSYIYICNVMGLFCCCCWCCCFYVYACVCVYLCVLFSCVYVFWISFSIHKCFGWGDSWGYGILSIYVGVYYIYMHRRRSLLCVYRYICRQKTRHNFIDKKY